MSQLQTTGSRIYVVPAGVDTSGIVSDKWPHRNVSAEPSNGECDAAIEWLMQTASDSDRIVVRPTTTLRLYKESLR